MGKPGKCYTERAILGNGIGRSERWTKRSGSTAGLDGGGQPIFPAAASGSSRAAATPRRRRHQSPNSGSRNMHEQRLRQRADIHRRKWLTILMIQRPPSVLRGAILRLNGRFNIYAETPGTPAADSSFCAELLDYAGSNSWAATPLVVAAPIQTHLVETQVVGVPNILGARAQPVYQGHAAGTDPTPACLVEGKDMLHDEHSAGSDLTPECLVALISTDGPEQHD